MSGELATRRMAGYLAEAAQRLRDRYPDEQIQLREYAVPVGLHSGPALWIEVVFNERPIHLFFKPDRLQGADEIIQKFAIAHDWGQLQ